MVKKSSFFQRRFYRIPYNNPVEFSILKYRHQNIAHLSSKKGLAVGNDLGEEGLSFISPYCLPVDMILRVVFTLPKGEKRILARVIRTKLSANGYLTAVQFINFNGNRREELRSYIATETKKNYKFLKYI